MGWKTINGRRYYFKSKREGGRVKTTYFGAGESGLLISLVEGEDRAERNQRGAERRNSRRRKRPWQIGSMTSRPWPTLR
jgi:hypothetical protein